MEIEILTSAGKELEGLTAQMVGWISARMGVGDVGFIGPAAIMTAPIWVPIVLVAGSIAAIVLGYFVYRHFSKKKAK